MINPIWDSVELSLPPDFGPKDLQLLVEAIRAYPNTASVVLLALAGAYHDGPDKVKELHEYILAFAERQIRIQEVGEP